MMHIALGNSSYSLVNKKNSDDYWGESMLNEIHIENRYCGKDGF